MARRPKFWLGLPPTTAYLNAIGRVIAQWAFFETEFDQAIRFMGLHPKGAALTKDLPFSFTKRTRIFCELVTICFQNCTPLRERLLQIAIDAKRSKVDRDLIAHGRWAGDAKTSGHLEVSVLRRGRYVHRKFTKELLVSRAAETSSLSRRLMAILHSQPDYSFPLAPEERNALQEFRAKYAKLPAPNYELLKLRHTRNHN